MSMPALITVVAFLYAPAQAEDACAENCDRLERHWADELARRGAKEASLSRAVLRAFCTRIVISTAAIVVAVVLRFIGPVSPQAQPLWSAAHRIILIGRESEWDEGNSLCSYIRTLRVRS